MYLSIKKIIYLYIRENRTRMYFTPILISLHLFVKEFVILNTFYLKNKSPSFNVIGKILFYVKKFLKEGKIMMFEYFKFVKCERKSFKLNITIKQN